MSPNEYARQGKHAVHVGDLVRVASETLERAGVKIADRGWSRGRVLRFVETPSSGLYAEVTAPGRAGTRTVSADRLTRMRGS